MRKYLLLMAAAAAIFASCGRPAKKAETPSAQEFAPYIKAYTGGMVPQDAELRIDLMQEVQGGVNPAGLFSAEPAIKGAVRWNSPSSVSFLPEPGALEPGKTYNISFHLEKLWADAPAFVYPIVAKGSTESGAILVPDSGRPFRVKQLTLKDGRMDVVLSQTPANAALQGMVELEGAARSYTEVQDSLLRVYYEGRQADLVLTLDGGLKSTDGQSLGEAFTHRFVADEQVPAVEIPLKGSILPTKDNFLLPFRAVNLSGVEVRVVKIYEKNVLSYLQDNDLGTGGNALRRSGRLVFTAQTCSWTLPRTSASGTPTA